MYIKYNIERFPYCWFSVNLFLSNGPKKKRKKEKQKRTGWGERGPPSAAVLLKEIF